MRNAAFAIILSAAAAFALVSCHSVDYYRAKAVKNAREYALPQLGDLKQTQLDYIRYAPPKVQDSQIFMRHPTKHGTMDKNNIAQFCIVWDDIPDLDYAIVVYGVSERRMNDWSPYRLIRKKFVLPDSFRDTARNTAKDFVMQNMLYLSDKLRNHIRFMPPRYYATKFELNVAKGQEGADQLARPPQVSLVWDAESPEWKIVVTGTCNPLYTAWVLNTGYEMKTADLEAVIDWKLTAVVDARLFAMGNIPYLSTAQLGEVKAALPSFVKTDFNLSKMKPPESLYMDDWTPEQTPVPVKQDGKPKTQWSLVWYSPGQKDVRTVITGMSGDDFRDWTPVEGALYLAEDVEKHTVK